MLIFPGCSPLYTFCEEEHLVLFPYEDVCPEIDLSYARDTDASETVAEILGGRFEIGERVIATNAGASYRYAKNIIHGEFPEGEAAIR